MKKFSILFLTALFSLSALELKAQNTPTSRSSATFIDWCESYSDSTRKAKETSKPILLLFTGTTWCPACMRLEKMVLSKPEFVQGLGDKLLFYKAEFPQPTPQGIENSPDKFLMDRYNITQFPTMVVVDSNGKQLFRVDYMGTDVNAYVNQLNQKLAQFQSR